MPSSVSIEVPGSGLAGVRWRKSTTIGALVGEKKRRLPPIVHPISVVKRARRLLTSTPDGIFSTVVEVQPLPNVSWLRS